MNLKTTTVLALIILAIIPVGAENTKKLSLAEYQKIITRQLPEIRKNILALKGAELDIEKAKGKRDISLNSSFKYSSTQYSNLSSFLYSGRTGGHSFNAGAVKTFVETGTSLSLDMTSNGTYPTGISGVQNSSVALSLKQPLMKNWLGKIDKFAEKDAAAALVIEEISTLQNDREILLSYDKLYFQWTLYRRLMQLTKEEILNAEKLHRQVARKVKVRLAENDDLQKAKVSLLNYRNLFKQYELTADDLENQIVVSTGLTKISPDHGQFQLNYKLTSPKNYIAVSFDKTLLNRHLNQTMKRYLLARDYHDNAQLPELNIIGSVTQKKEATSFSESMKMSDTDYYAGFEITHTLGNRSNKAAYRQSLLKIKELKEEQRAVKQNYRKNLLSTIDAINKYRSMSEIKNETVAALRSQYATEYRKYTQARLNLQYLLDTRNSIMAEEINILNLQFQLITLDLDYQNLTAK